MIIMMVIIIIIISSSSSSSSSSSIGFVVVSMCDIWFNLHSLAGMWSLVSITDS